MTFLKRTVSFLLAASLFLSLTACDEPVSIHSELPSGEPIHSVSDTSSTPAFDESLLAYLDTRLTGSYAVSPISFRYALGLLLEGASGDTKTELLQALGVESAEEWTAYCTTFNGFVSRFDEELKAEQEQFRRDVAAGYLPSDAAEPFRALRVADSVWKRDDIKADFTEAYRNAVTSHYGAEYATFTPENAVKKINAWASEKTEKMIERLLPDNYDTSHLAVVLMNALYFKDSWVHSFSASDSQEGDFHTADGKTVTKTFMSQTEEFSYYADGETQLVLLPMNGGVTAAFVLGSTEDLDEKIASATERCVTVRLPKLDLETSLSSGELVGFLQSRGVNAAFDENRADFSAMIDHDIYVSDILQKTRVKTDEDGIEAAAVTAVMMRDCCIVDPSEPVIFNADRPFSFRLYTTCNEKTAVLFAGRITE